MLPKVDIPSPCHEDWDKMKIGIRSRHCESCCKDVVDFTGMSRQEILAYLIKNYNSEVCGRVKKSQLDFSYPEFMITIQALSKKPNNSNLSFYLLSMSALIMASCGNPDANNNRVLPADSASVLTSNTNRPKTDTDMPAASEHSDVLSKTLPTAEITENRKLHFDDIDVSGLMTTSYNYEILPDSTVIYSAADSMPEFPGGVDSLISYIQANLIYPAWERAHQIEGILYASFVVTETGKIKHIRIDREPSGSRNFGNEVTRVINNMPDWIPGKQNGKNVCVRYSIPAKFKL